MGTHMTFTRANDGGQETVNLSIKETDQNISFLNQLDNMEEEEQEQPLALTRDTPVSDSNHTTESPLNFSTSGGAGAGAKTGAEDEDSDDERLVIKE